MKNALLGAAAVFAIIAPAAAHADTTGHIDLSYQTANIDSGIDYDVDAWTLGGALIMPIEGAWNLQFAASHENYTYENSEYDSAATAVTAHGIYRNESYAFGGYAGFGGIYSQTLYMAGVEGQFYLPNATIGGTVSYGATSDAYDYTSWDARVNGSYFFTPQFAANATVAYTSWDDYDTDVTGLGIGAEYRFSNCPFSVTGNYLHESWEYGSSDADADVFKLGLTYDFGGLSLQERSQQGASFDGASQFMDVWTRWD